MGKREGDGDRSRKTASERTSEIYLYIDRQIDREKERERERERV